MELKKDPGSSLSPVGMSWVLLDKSGVTCFSSLRPCFSVIAQVTPSLSAFPIVATSVSRVQQGALRMLCGSGCLLIKVDLEKYIKRQSH